MEDNTHAHTHTHIHTCTYTLLQSGGVRQKGGEGNTRIAFSPVHMRFNVHSALDLPVNLLFFPLLLPFPRDALEDPFSICRPKQPWIWIGTAIAGPRPETSSPSSWSSAEYELAGPSARIIHAYPTRRRKAQSAGKVDCQEKLD